MRNHEEMNSPQRATVVGRLATDEATARRLMERFGECFAPEEAAASAFATPGRGWSVAVHFRARPDEPAVRALIALVAGEEAAHALVFEEIAETDWVQASLAGLQPVAVGRFIVHGAHDRARVKPDRIGIEVEAALAFGTGHHGTTRGCLEELGRFAKKRRGSPPRVLDVGTGSGVLAIAAAKGLHACVLAGEIDKLAAAVARRNATLNGVAGSVEVIRADGVADARFRHGAPFDLAFANIVLAPLKRLARPLARLLAPNARLVLSGLVPSQAAAAVAAYRPHGLVFERRLLRDDWITLVLRRPPSRRRFSRSRRAQY